MAAFERINVAFSRAQNLLIIVGAKELYDNLAVPIPNMDTGEILWQCCDDDGWNRWETESSGDDWDIDEADLEMGYNPYEGCYDYDC